MSIGQKTFRYIIFFAVSLIICAAMFVSEKYWMPKKLTPQMIAEDVFVKNGLQENFMDLGRKIQSGEFPLVDHVAFHVTTPAYKASIVRMAETKSSISFVKYRVMMDFFFPYTVFLRHKKIDTILIDLDTKQNQEFAELFWNIK